MTNPVQMSKPGRPLDAVVNYMREVGGTDAEARLADEQIESLANSLCDWAASLDGGERGVRVQAGIGAGLSDPAMVLLEVVGPDIPFLVDSILAECVDHGAQIASVFHPVLPGEGAASKSLIQVHLLGLTLAEADRLKQDVEDILKDLQIVVNDHQSMRARMQAERDRLAALTHLDTDEQAEATAFLDWLSNEHFVFLGARTYEFEVGSDGRFIREEPTMVEGSNLGLLRNEDLNVLSRGAEPTVLTGSAQDFLQMPQPLIVAKSTLVSRIHRRVRADYVGVKHYDDKGRVVGETRFLGLFTAEAYDETARSVPLIRRRVAKVREAIGVPAGGHAWKTLSNILETWPRDELLQTDIETLAPMARGVLHLQERPRTRLFVRRDRFGRFVSAIVYIPRDAYDSDLRQRMVSLLEDAFQARLLNFEPRFSQERLVRVLFQLELEPGSPSPDTDDLERRIASLSVRWQDAFREAILMAELTDYARDGAMCFVDAFNAAYREAFSPAEALEDVAELAELSSDQEIRMRVYRAAGDGDDTLRAKVYSRGKSIALSESVPVFENMGLFVDFETGYRARPTDRPDRDAPDTYWIHDVLMRTESGASVDLDSVGAFVEAAFAAVWTGAAENDGFNRLILSAGASWQEADLLRGLSAYRRQSGLDPAKPSQITALTRHKDITVHLLGLFRALFDPTSDESLQVREAAAKLIRSHIRQSLADVPSLEDDRVLRRLCDLIMSIQRTNFFQPERAAPLAFKIASGELEELPKPKPYREIFVASPVVEGVHLRFGPVARGGLRWSDRPNDFRTEVLGLVKAQQVKNAVIVPVGSKGGFFPKQLPVGGSREAVREAGITAYRAFISALLSVTDNLVDGEVQHPAATVVRDGADPYLVVAADKGTATFSDIANEISTGLGFWLGDAFASGGSAGYDHKAMGITARGAWEAVKRHFLEMGTDIQAEPFTVVGVGDMSGDVFGNGMLLSRQIRLRAAFNHLHIFIDPNPDDPERLWEERKRLFDLPRSSWQDYDTSLISEGGGIFERAAKAIPLTDEIKAMTGLTAGEVTPDELIHALLQAETDLLWFGGIGTYIKAAEERDAEVGDRANDAIRVDADAVRASVIGEGANLGITQAGRIAFAARGGRINTDAIDNSAGVDSSDHEVNIKILLSEAMRRGALPRGERNTLLASMTDDVAAHVLAHNISQTGALTLTEATAAQNHDALERMMLWLESRGVLDRDVEGLPSSDEMAARGAERKWLTRPELAVLMAWAKIVLFDDIVASDLPDDAYFRPVLDAYFPEALQPYSEIMDRHRLKREIIATVLANRMIDTGGLVLLQHLREEADAPCANLVRGFEIAAAAAAPADLPGKLQTEGAGLSAEAQTALNLEYVAVLRQWTSQIVQTGMPDTTENLVNRYQSGVETLLKEAATIAPPYAAQRAERASKRLVRVGASKPLAKTATNLGLLALAPRFVDVATETGGDLIETAEMFSKIAKQVHYDRLYAGATDALAQMSQWDRLATQRQLNALTDVQVDVVRTLVDTGSTVDAFLRTRAGQASNLNDSLKALGMGRQWSFAKFSLAADMVRRFLA